MDRVFTKEEVDAIREANVERNVVYNQEKASSEVDSPEEPASALAPVADAQQKRNLKKRTAVGRRFTVAPQANDLENYFDPNKVLHIQEQSLNIPEEADPEKEMIQKKIQENIKKALKSHAAKKVPIERRKEVEVPQQNTDIQMLNIFDDEKGAGPSIDFQTVPEERPGGQEKPAEIG